MPVAAIEPFIETFTRPGDVVADFFGGSGMTGFSGSKFGRKAKLSDISALGRHIARGYVTRVSPQALREVAERVVTNAREAIGDLYTTRRASDGAEVEMLRTVGPLLISVLPAILPLFIIGTYRTKAMLPKLARPAKPLWCAATGNAAQIRRSKLLRATKKDDCAEQPVSDFDIRKINKAARDSRQSQIPSLNIDEEREMFSRSGLGKAGLTRTGGFFLTTQRHCLARTVARH